MTLTLKDRTPPAEVPKQFYQARKKLSDEARNLPTGALGPFVNDEYSDVTFALYALKAPEMAPRELVRQAEPIRQQMLHVAGVSSVSGRSGFLSSFPMPGWRCSASAHAIFLQPCNVRMR
jgi:multidrug efflux pump subunit AcrB